MINYEIIADSISHYENKGFIRVETPWLVTKQVSNITKPDPDIQDYQIKHNNKLLVASGEQGFLYQYLKEFLPKGRYQTTTPCFRSESFDFHHSKYFMKNELIETKSVHPNTLTFIIQHALSFFKKYLTEAEVIQKSDNEFDIEWKGHELGSYGIRSCEFLEWIYGTGVAEPRLSNIIRLSNKEDGIS